MTKISIKPHVYNEEKLKKYLKGFIKCDGKYPESAIKAAARLKEFIEPCKKPGYAYCFGPYHNIINIILENKAIERRNNAYSDYWRHPVDFDSIRVVYDFDDCLKQAETGLIKEVKSIKHDVLYDFTNGYIPDYSQYWFFVYLSLINKFNPTFIKPFIDKFINDLKTINKYKFSDRVNKLIGDLDIMYDMVLKTN